MTSAIFEIDNLKHFYDNRLILNIEQLTIYKGEIIAIVGPSGSGKSTLLRLLNFLESPSQGKITFDSMTASPQLSLLTRRRVGTMFQNPILLKRSVKENIKYGLSLRNEKLDNETEHYWVEKLGLEHVFDQSAKKLSVGESHRVALVRTLLTKPDVLLLDEPTANLDPYNVSLIEDIILEENRNNNITIVLVTHNVFQAKRVADRTALLLNGELIELEKSDQFFNNPKNIKTKDFIEGKMVY